MRIEQVIPNMLDAVWSDVSHWLNAIQGQKDYDTSQLQMMVRNGSVCLVVALNDEEKISGAACIEFINYPKRRVAFVKAIGGRGIINKDTFEQLKVWCKSCGASVIRGFGSEAIARLYKPIGFEETARTFECQL